MNIEASKDRVWKAKISIGENKLDIMLYDTFDNGIVFKEDFIPKLKTVLTAYEHYSAGEILTEIVSPEGEDFSRYAVFVILLQLKPKEEEDYGEEHGFLFALRKDGKVHLAGVSDIDLELDDFIDILSIAFESPDMVNSLIMAYTPD